MYALGLDGSSQTGLISSCFCITVHPSRSGTSGVVSRIGARAVRGLTAAVAVAVDILTHGLLPIAVEAMSSLSQEYHGMARHFFGLRL